MVHSFGSLLQTIFQQEIKIIQLVTAYDLWLFRTVSNHSHVVVESHNS